MVLPGGGERGTGSAAGRAGAGAARGTAAAAARPRLRASSSWHNSHHQRSGTKDQKYVGGSGQWTVTPSVQ